MDNRKDVWPPPIESQPQPDLPRLVDRKATILGLLSFCLAAIGSVIIIGFVTHNHLLHMNQPVYLPSGQVMFVVDGRDLYGVLVNLVAIVVGITGRRSQWGIWALSVAVATIGLDFVSILLHW